MKQSPNTGEKKGDLLSNCCGADFDAFGFPRGDGFYDEKCLKCEKLCDVSWQETKPSRQKDTKPKHSIHSKKDRYQPPSSVQGWEEELYKLYVKDTDDWNYWKKVVWSILDEEKEELRIAIESSKLDDRPEIKTWLFGKDFTKGYNKAVDEILELL